jgi:ribosomal protein L31E
MGDEEVRQAKQDKAKKQTVEKTAKKKADVAPKKEEKTSEKTADAKEKTEDQKEEKEVEKKEAKKKEKEEISKIITEREYIVPLRKEWLKVPEYKRANKAVKALKQFIAQHMKIYDRDLKKIKIDVLVNNEIRFKGMRKPLAKIKVKAMKREDGTVDVKLVDIPKHIEFELARKAKKEVEKSKKEKEKSKIMAAAEKLKKEQEVKKEEDEDTKEKEAASKEATQQMEKAQAKQAKHTTSAKKQPVVQRKALQK